MNTHNITSARYSTESTSIDAPVTATRNGREEHRRANDDIEGGGMLAYLADGGKIDPYVDPPLTEADYASAIQKEINERARKLGYEDSVSLVSYLTSSVDQWRMEAEAFVLWRDKMWSTAYVKQKEVIDLGSTQPSVVDLVSELKAEIERGT